MKRLSHTLRVVAWLGILPAFHAAHAMVISGSIVDPNGAGIPSAVICSTLPQDSCAISDSLGAFVLHSLAEPPPEKPPVDTLPPVIPDSTPIVTPPPVVPPADTTKGPSDTAHTAKEDTVRKEEPPVPPRKDTLTVGLSHTAGASQGGGNDEKGLFFDVLGRRVRALVKGSRSPGLSARTLAAGRYFTRRAASGARSASPMPSLRIQGTVEVPLLVVKRGYQNANYLSKAGSDSGIRIQLSPLPKITGYMDRISYLPGDSATAYLHSSGAYGRRPVVLYDAAGDSVDQVESQVDIQSTTTAQPWQDGMGFTPTFRYAIPGLKSGLYYWEKNVPFVVRDATDSAQIVVVFPSNTLNAYTSAGGKSLYKSVAPDTSGKSSTVSFLRPLVDDGLHRPFFEWMSKQAWTGVAYVSDMDLDDYSKFGAAKLLIIAGHSEYWSRKARENFDRFVNAGKNALILSGNTMWWQVRYTDSGNGLICYKDSLLDPNPDPLMKTVNWPSGYLGMSVLSSIGADFNHGGYGLKVDSGWDGYKITAPRSPLLEGTGLKAGDTLSLPTSEYDGTLFVGVDSTGNPKINAAGLGFDKVELIGYDYGMRNAKTIPSFIAFRRTASSGIVVNAASTNWCSAVGIGSSGSDLIRRITTNAIRKLAGGEQIFSP